MEKLGYCLLMVCSVALFLFTEDDNLLAGGVSGVLFALGGTKLLFT